MQEDPELAYFQAQLLDLLSEEQSPREVLKSLKSDTRLRQFKDYLESFQPDMVAVAQELVKKWGQKTTQEETV